MAAGKLDRRVVFTPPKVVADGYGNEESGWDDAQDVQVWAGISYRSGKEGVEEGRRTGQGFYKIKIRQSEAAKAITTDWRMVLVATGQEFDIVEVDAVTDRAYVWISAITMTEITL